jgi:hypothetical protein
MRVFERGAFSTPVRAVLNVLIAIVVFQVAAEALLVLVLISNPLHPLGARFQVTTLAEVPTDVWPTDNLVRIEPGSASATVEPWAFIIFRPSTRSFVLATATASFAWWACVALVLLQLRRVLSNMSVATPFPHDNIRRIRFVGWGILGMAATQLVMDAGMIAYMRMAVTVAGRPSVIPTAMLLVDFPLGTILAGLAVLILAEIFRAGADLQDEQALTV